MYVCVCMYGWMDGWMDVWMDGWMDGWLAGWMDGWTDGWVDGWMDAWLSVCLSGCLSVCMYACMHVCMYIHLQVELHFQVSYHWGTRRVGLRIVRLGVPHLVSGAGNQHWPAPRQPHKGNRKCWTNDPFLYLPTYLSTSTYLVYLPNNQAIKPIYFGNVLGQRGNQQ